MIFGIFTSVSIFCLMCVALIQPRGTTSPSLFNCDLVALDHERVSPAVMVVIVTNTAAGLPIPLAVFHLQLSISCSPSIFN